jgi:hypothetical protein
VAQVWCQELLRVAIEKRSFGYIPSNDKDAIENPAIWKGLDQPTREEKILLATLLDGRNKLEQLSENVPMSTYSALADMLWAGVMKTKTNERMELIGEAWDRTTLRYGRNQRLTDLFSNEKAVKPNPTTQTGSGFLTQKEKILVAKMLEAYDKIQTFPLSMPQDEWDSVSDLLYHDVMRTRTDERLHLVSAAFERDTRKGSDER